MKKTITFSRTFPSSHPNKGESTYFVEAILTQLGINYKVGRYFIWLQENNPDISSIYLMKFWDSLRRDVAPKSHTIRSHKRPLKVGDFIKPVCWAGRPYHKTEEGYWQINFAPEIEVVKTWKFEVDLNGIYCINDKYIGDNTEKILATNDGLTQEQMQFWFMPNMKKPKEFEGTIYCWNDKVEY